MYKVQCFLIIITWTIATAMDVHQCLDNCHRTALEGIYAECGESLSDIIECADKGYAYEWKICNDACKSLDTLTNSMCLNQAKCNHIRNEIRSLLLYLFDQSDYELENLKKFKRDTDPVTLDVDQTRIETYNVDGEKSYSKSSRTKTGQSVTIKDGNVSQEVHDSRITNDTNKNYLKDQGEKYEMGPDAQYHHSTHDDIIDDESGRESNKTKGYSGNYKLKDMPAAIAQTQLMLSTETKNYPDGAENQLYPNNDQNGQPGGAGDQLNPNNDQNGGAGNDQFTSTTEDNNNGVTMQENGQYTTPINTDQNGVPPNEVPPNGGYFSMVNYQANAGTQIAVGHNTDNAANENNSIDRNDQSFTDAQASVGPMEDQANANGYITQTGEWQPLPENNNGWVQNEINYPPGLPTGCRARWLREHGIIE